VTNKQLSTPFPGRLYGHKQHTAHTKAHSRQKSTFTIKNVTHYTLINTYHNRRAAPHERLRGCVTV